MKSFTDRVAAITGAASGIGRSLAISLARKGCEVALSDVDERGLAETARLVSAAAPRIRVSTKKVDVANVDVVRAWANAVASEHGRCNLIFNNAGISVAATVEGIEKADFARVIDTDFWGVVHGTQAFLPYLRASGDGHVINMSSILGLIGFPGQCAYNAAKFAVRGYTDALRIELEITRAPVSATCIHPGGIKTNIARASKIHSSMADLGVTDSEKSVRQFEAAFRVTADDAAEAILRGVQKNARRVLIGADARVIDLLHRAIPAHYHGILIRTSRKLFDKYGRAAANVAPPPKTGTSTRAASSSSSN